MIVDLHVVLSEEEYVNAPGVEYEVAPGVTVKMLPPTHDLKQKFLATAKEADGEDAPPEGLSATDVELAKMVTAGAWPERGQLLDPVVRVLIENFTYACFGINPRRRDFMTPSSAGAALTRVNPDANAGRSAGTEATTPS